MLKFKIIGLALALVLIAGLVAVASGATGAYFSDIETGKVSGAIGDITVNATGGTVGEGDGINFYWNNMLPGVVYSAPMNVQNISEKNSQDLYLRFHNLTALSALNQLGSYGAVTITVDGVPVFQSNNLNDNTARGATIGNGGALPEWILLAENVGPTVSRTVVFKFAYASKMTTQEPGGVFNKYPVPATVGNRCLNGDAYFNGTSYAVQALASEGTAWQNYPWNGGAGNGTYNPVYNPSFTYYAQVTVRNVDGQGGGLPFQIVATQTDVLPTDTGTSAPVIAP